MAPVAGSTLGEVNRAEVWAVSPVTRKEHQITYHCQFASAASAVVQGTHLDDVIEARDSRRERIDGGAGVDYAIVDRVDIVARDCEHLERS